MLKYYDFSGVSFLVDKRFKCEIASENVSARFDLVHNPTVPYLTDSIMEKEIWYGSQGELFDAMSEKTKY